MWERMMSGEDSQLACRVGFGVYLVACRTSAYMRTRRQCSDRQKTERYGTEGSLM